MYVVENLSTALLNVMMCPVVIGIGLGLTAAISGLSFGLKLNTTPSCVIRDFLWSY